MHELSNFLPSQKVFTQKHLFISSWTKCLESVQVATQARDIIPGFSNDKIRPGLFYQKCT